MKHFYPFLFTLLISSLGFSQTTIYTQDFETLNTGYTASATEGSGFIDVFNRTVANVGGNTTNVWAVEDTNITPATITLDQIDVTGFSDFTFSIDMIAHHFNDWDNSDTFSITYSLDGGASQNLLWVRNNGATFNQLPSLDTDFDGIGDCGAGTLPALTTGTSGCSTSSDVFATFSSSTIALSGNSTLDITLSFEGLDANDEGIYLDNIEVVATSASTDTEVQFASASASVSEGDGTYNLEVAITNEDTNPTQVEVALTTGDAADINNYTTQTVTFPASSSANETVVITITDDMVFESDETLTFTLQNVSGGNNAQIGVQNTFDLTITNNDLAPPITLPYNEDFADCGAAEWFTFDQAGDDGDVWTCGSGEYAMNGFGGSVDDIDWLISNFRVDFDAQSNETIVVETRNRFGNLVNEAGEFELRYSTDYAGSGDPTLATWTPLTFDPANTSDNATLSAITATNVDASGITGIAYLAFVYDMTGVGAEDWRVSDVSIVSGTPPTEVEFLMTSATVSEGSGTYDLEFTITNEDAINDTTFDVVLTSGTAVDIDNYTTQLVTFTGGSSTNQIVTITITDDAIEELDEIFTFEIQNVAGGNSAVVGSNNSFDLTIAANDAPAVPAGWQISTLDTAFIIDFEATVTDVNVDAYAGTGFESSPASGQLDSDAWAVTGLSDGSLSFGGTGTSGDFTGADDGGVTGGGLYDFDTGSGNSTFGFQPTGGDFTPGTITLRAQNQTGSTVTSADIAYLIYVFNNEARSGSFNFSYSTDDISYTAIPALDFTSDAAEDTTPNWESNFRSTVITGLSILNGEYLYLRWTFNDVSGSGSRDEFALDDISLKFNPTSFTYTYDNAWFPSDPNGVSTGVDNIIVSAGDAILTTNTTCNQFTVSEGASLTINSGVTLTASTLDLDSTSDEFASLILDGTLAGGTAGNVTYRRYINGAGSGTTGGNDLITSPVTGVSFVDFVQDPENEFNLFGSPDNGSTSILEYLFGPFDNELAGDYVTYFINDPLNGGAPVGDGDDASETIDPVKGYRAGTFGGTTLAFRGGINSGSVSTSDFNDYGFDAPDIEIWNLVGNPYPSYLDAQAFLTTNGGVIDETVLDPNFNAIYAYNDNTDGASRWTIINSVQNNTRNIAPGQGFFVASNGTGQLSFTPAMRTTVGTDDFILGRNTNVITHLGLTLSNDQEIYETDFYFTSNASTSLDPSYDAGVYSGNASGFSLYSHLVEDNQGIPMAIQSLGETDYDDVVIPLGVNSNQGEQITFSITDNNLPSSVNVYLEDNVTNTFTLLNTSDYILTPNTNLAGTGRFFLHFTNSPLSVTDDPFYSLTIYTSNRSINIAGEVDDNTIANVYDIQGRLITSKILTSNLRLQSIDVNAINAGVYIVELNNGNQNTTQKVILK
ncbi:Calx-beta domain-containing protein [Winogradskyella sp.]|uniref:beta strand repeat-containing protein n=1 Tax=Winogradskyella sp. TaxID=1883156 RepID=UPI002632C89C|nr:Calx-beta domain-containing protein [Winogradskyella sp.]